jgi:hypothetical protein
MIDIMKAKIYHMLSDSEQGNLSESAHHSVAGDKGTELKNVACW